ncbi:MAG: leucine-rich repeat domain-containing protein [Oscillospiraceae bacterium]|nr:leucine-rich repeat domain-containing protein [Oscillospiraceae bacterium]
MIINHAFCPLCGSVIPVDLSQEAMICPDCGRPFMNAQAITADPTPAPSVAPFSKKEFSTTPLSDLEIERGVLLRYKGKNSYVILPDCIKEIGSNAFLAARNLRSIVLPDSITKIGAQAFSECRQLVKLRIPDAVTLIGKGAFSGCKSLTEVTIPGGVQIVASDTFWGCTALRSVHFPAALRRIETNAFHGCTALLSAGVPTGSYIADGAFPVHTNIIQI